MDARTVLIIDDDQKVLEALKDVLETDNYIVHTARDGASGIRSFDSDSPDLVITDINMPDVEGIELVRNLAKRNRKVPVIAISGDPVGANFLKAARLLGAVDTLLKPFSIAELREKVSSALAGGKPGAPEGDQG